MTIDTTELRRDAKTILFGPSSLTYENDLTAQRLAHNAIVLADEIDRLRGEVEALRSTEQQLADQCEDDTAIRELCRPLIGDQVDGDSYAVPPIVDVVAWAIDAAWNAAVEAAAKVMEENFDSVGEKPSAFIRALTRPARSNADAT